jgi:hypothetical protein
MSMKRSLFVLGLLVVPMVFSHKRVILDEDTQDDSSAEQE